jgi:hypothetical protein
VRGIERRGCRDDFLEHAGPMGAKVRIAKVRLRLRRVDQDNGRCTAAEIRST